MATYSHLWFSWGVMTPYPIRIRLWIHLRHMGTSQARSYNDTHVHMAIVLEIITYVPPIYTMDHYDVAFKLNDIPLAYK